MHNICKFSPISRYGPQISAAKYPAYLQFPEKFPFTKGKLMRVSAFLYIVTIVLCLTGCSKLTLWGKTPVPTQQGSEMVKPTDKTAQNQIAGRESEADKAPGDLARDDHNDSTDQAPTGGTAVTITEDTIWSGRVSIQGAVAVSPQTTLTISPGTIVEFGRSPVRDSASVLLVHGRLIAQGTEEQPVRFTSDSADTGTAAWRGIVFLASQKKNVLDHCVVEGAETGVDAAYSTITVKNSRFSKCRTALMAQDCLVHVSGVAASDCEFGISLQDSEAEVVDGSLSSNGKGIFVQKTSLYLSGTKISGNKADGLSAQGSQLKIVGNTISRNGSGLTLSSCEGTVSGNLIAENKDYGISLAGSRIKVAANDISRNGGIGIRTADGRGIAWGNSISSNGRYDLYNEGSESFRAIGNWWGGTGDTGSTGKIYDSRTNPGSGKVQFFPVLKNKPTIVP
jgi:parallel beta-helix repeat protein